MQTVVKVLLSLQSSAELDLLDDLAFPWLDLKNPDRGSLGCPDRQVALDFLEGIAQRSARQLPPPTTSIALGEWQEKGWRGLLEVAKHFDFAKVAFAGARSDHSWHDEVLELPSQLNMPGRLIPVYYADAELVHAPEWAAVLAVARRLQSPYLLIDTCDKAAGRIWDYLSIDGLRSLSQQAKRAGVRLSIAGSIRLDELGSACQAGAEVVGLRSAACVNGSRRAMLGRDRLRVIAQHFFLDPVSPLPRPSDAAAAPRPLSPSSP